MNVLHRAFVLALALLFTAAPALAQREPKRAPPKTRKVETLSKRVANLLNEVNAAMLEEDYETAEKRLNRIPEAKQLNGHEESMVHRSFGYLYSSQEKYPRAITSFQRAVDIGGLPDSIALNTQYNLGQLYMLTDDYERGIATLLDWFNKAENPAASAYMLMANAHAQRAASAPEAEERKHYRDAWNWAKQGLAKMDPTKPREAWLRLGAQLNLTLENYQDATNWLEQLLPLWPKETYLKQLTAVHGQLEKPQKALIAMELAHKENYLDESKELVRLAQLYLYNEVPYKAAVLMQTRMDDGTIEKEEKNYKLLADAWTLSREYERALAPLAAAAKLSDDGELWVRLGRLHIDSERWKEAGVAIRKGLNKGGLKSKGEAWLLLGITQFQRKQFESARKSFSNAAKDPKTRKSGRQWVTAINARAQ